MTDIILHHYETSPYAEKVRLGLGLKGLAWASVEIPVIMPKPDLTALTGGYRKTPVLQIGADIYCDSQLIMRELERRHPSPSFYPAGRGSADALAWWAEKTMFSPAVSIVFAKRPDTLPEGFLEDRAKFSGRNIDPVAMMAAVPNLLDQLRAHFDWLDQMLADGRSFLQGSAAGLADLAAYHPVWFLQQNFGSAAAPLDGFPRLLTWTERVAAIGHGRQSEMTSQEALDAARAATSIVTATADPRDPTPAEDLANEISKALGPPLAGIPLDGEVLSLDIAQPAQLLPKRLPIPAFRVVDAGDGTCGDDDRNPVLLRPLLRLHRLGCSREQQAYSEIPPPHSISSSARASNVVGIVRFSKRAVFKLMLIPPAIPPSPLVKAGERAPGIEITFEKKRQKRRTRRLRLFKALQARIEANQRQPLLAAQRLWVQYRDANCAFYGTRNGSIRQVQAAERIRSMTEDRARELEEAIKLG